MKAINNIINCQPYTMKKQLNKYQTLFKYRLFQIKMKFTQIPINLPMILMQCAKT